MIIDLGKAAHHFQLSKRETEVVRLVCQGLTSKKIGETLFVCEHTVKDHIKSIMTKMEARSRTAVVSALLRFHRISFVVTQ